MAFNLIVLSVLITHWNAEGDPFSFRLLARYRLSLQKKAAH